MEVQLLDFFGLPRHLCHTIRAPTSRPEISYRFTKVSDLDAAVQRIQSTVEATSLADHERGIIFCNTLADCDSISAVLGHPKYYGTMDAKQKSSIFHQWKRGDSKWLVATSAFGNGINYPSVRYILHFLACRNICLYKQEAGRAGRDGQPATATQCRRIEIHNFLDGQPVTCSALNMSQLCDVCQVCEYIIFVH